MREDQETIDSIANLIREYLRAHPKAADTLEGITDWWLPVRDRKASTELVQKALDSLVARDEIRRVRSPDGHVLYMRGGW